MIENEIRKMGRNMSVVHVGKQEESIADSGLFYKEEFGSNGKRKRKTHKNLNHTHQSRWQEAINFEVKLSILVRQFSKWGWKRKEKEEMESGALRSSKGTDGGIRLEMGGA